MIPPEPAASPGSGASPELGPTPPADDAPPPEPGRAGTSTFTIEGRSAPALFVIGWLASLMGLGMVVIALLGGGTPMATGLAVLGLVVLAIGLIAGAGSQGIERRARGRVDYPGPSPVLVFLATVPVTFLAVILIAVPLTIVGVAVDGPFGRLASVAAQALIYVGLIRLLVVDTRALSWAAMGVRRPDGRTLGELAGGAVWALPVIVLTVPVALLLTAIFPVQPVSPLPPTGDATGLLLNLLAGAIVAPIGEELMFRAFATTAWARDLGPRRALIRGALFFALVHVLTITGATAGEALGQAVIGFATRIPVALVLGWLFLRRGSIWAPIGLHATFNAILLVLAEAAFQGGAV